MTIFAIRNPLVVFYKAKEKRKELSYRYIIHLV